MKAIVLKGAGGTDQLKLEEVPDPSPQKGEVLVKVKAFSINPVDIKTRKGAAFYNTLRENNPLILGWDISGEVVEAGDGVNGLKKGDAVFGMVNFPGHGKGYAEYVAAPTDHLAHKPSQLSHEAAAAATLALLTAWQALVQVANVQGGQKVLIQAAAGGVGHFAVQVAKHLGAYVVGTGSGANKEFVLQLGANEFIDYTEGAFEEAVQNVDLVFDAVGGAYPLRSLSTLKEGGKLIAIAGGLTDEVKREAESKKVEASSYLVHSSGADMNELAGLLQKEIIKPHVFKTYAFDEISKAHQQVETGRTRGKVVLTV